MATPLPNHGPLRPLHRHPWEFAGITFAAAMDRTRDADDLAKWFGERTGGHYSEINADEAVVLMLSRGLFTLAHLTVKSFRSEKL